MVSMLGQHEAELSPCTVLPALWDRFLWKELAMHGQPWGLFVPGV